MDYRTLALVCAAGTWLGCSEPSDESPDSDNPFVANANDERIKDPDGDFDEDGLTNVQELRGWEVIVNSTGYAELTDIYTVYSDPFSADTDSDGLPDVEEFKLRTNPQTYDTDGDALSDAEEVTRWGTSPVSVDTDGDSRGDRGGNDISPWSRMFDGAELDLQVDPENPSGPMLAGPHATAPHLADSDGDNVSDYDEMLDPGRSPVVAEVPTIEIYPTPGSAVELAYNSVLTSSNSQTEGYGVQLDVNESMSIEHSTKTTNTTTFETEVWGKVMGYVAAGCCSEIVKADAEVTLGWKLGLKNETSFNVSFGIEAALETRSTFDYTQSQVESEEIVVTGGTLRMSVDVVNTGPLPVRVSDIAVTVNYVKPTPTGFAPATLTELIPEEFQSEAVLMPGERQTLIMSNEGVPVGAMDAVMSDPRSLSVSLARYTIADREGTDYDFVFPDVHARCATVIINSPDGIQQFYVASDVGRHPDGSRVGVSLGNALSAVGIDFEAIPVERDAAEGTDGYYIRIGDVETVLHEGPARSLQANGADATGYPLSGGPGERILRTGWGGIVDRFEGPKPEFATDFFSFMMLPGDVVNVVQVEDQDRDGLASIEEAMYGSSDYQVHSDATLDKPIGDGLSDFWEIREGWRVTPTNGVTYRVYPNPASQDSDNDGLRDDEEIGAGGIPTDPLLADTDFDGYTDALERANASGTLNPVRPDARTQPSATCTYTQSQANERTYSIAVSDAGADINRLILDVGDGSPNQVVSWAPNDPQPTAPLVFVSTPLIHPSLELARVFVRDATGDQVIARCARQN